MGSTMEFTVRLKQIVLVVRASEPLGRKNPAVTVRNEMMCVQLQVHWIFLTIVFDIQFYKKN